MDLDANDDESSQIIDIIDPTVGVATHTQAWKDKAILDADVSLKTKNNIQTLIENSKE